MKKKAAPSLRDLREILPRGRSGQGKIEHVFKNAAACETLGLPNRVAHFVLVTDGTEYHVDAILQSDSWEPKKGELVRFDRQPEGVKDEYLHATLLSA